jgi:hypothetical protein
MDSYSIVVIILAVALSVSLVVWIAAGILVIKVLGRVREATNSARAAVEHVEEFTAQLKNVGKFTAVGSAIREASKFFNARKKGD